VQKVPWDGIDPTWVYGSGAGLLAQALRKSRAKIVRSADLDVRRNHAHGMDLWQWESQWRVNALQSELLGRFQVQGSALFLTEPVEMGPKQNTSRVKCNRVFDIRKHRGASFDNQVDMVLRAAAEREDRLPEILSQADDFWPFFESLVGANVAFSPHLGELLAVAHGLTVHVVMALKQAVAARRPAQCSTLVAPVITTPGHGSLPSGHATLAALYSELLRGLLYLGNSAFELERCTQLDRLARRIAFNRVVAGVHFQFDSVVGYALGTQLARVLLRMAGHRRAPPALVNDDGFDVIGGKDLTLNETVGDRPAETSGTYPCSVCPGFAELWRRTQVELKPLRV
jgi:PAP2 superfamily